MNLNTRNAFLHNFMLTLMEQDIKPSEFDKYTSSAMKVWDSHQVKNGMLVPMEILTHKKFKRFLSERIEIEH